MRGREDVGAVWADAPRKRSRTLIWSIECTDGDSPPCTQKIWSSITAESVRKSNMSVKYVQTCDDPYLRTHSV
jgi:hypothetical protein